jgi:hypothetical protein
MPLKEIIEDLELFLKKAQEEMERYKKEDDERASNTMPNCRMGKPEL